MNDTETTMTPELVKRATGIHDLDTVTHGGLPAGGATLVVGEPGCGKTILGLLKSSGAESALLALERLLAVTRSRCITTMLTSLSEADDPFSESSLSHASTLADT